MLARYPGGSAGIGLVATTYPDALVKACLEGNLALFDMPAQTSQGAGATIRDLDAPPADPLRASLFHAALEAGLGRFGAIFERSTAEGAHATITFNFAGTGGSMARPDPPLVRRCRQAAGPLVTETLRHARPTLPRAPDLTRIEREVLALTAGGLTYAEVGARMGISRWTAISHMKKIERRLNVATRAEAISEGVRRGLVDKVAGPPPNRDER